MSDSELKGYPDKPFPVWYRLPLHHLPMGSWVRLPREVMLHGSQLLAAINSDLVEAQSAAFLIDNRLIFKRPTTPTLKSPIDQVHTAIWRTLQPHGFYCVLADPLMPLFTITLDLRVDTHISLFIESNLPNLDHSWMFRCLDLDGLPLIPSLHNNQVMIFAHGHVDRTGLEQGLFKWAIEVVQQYLGNLNMEGAFIALATVDPEPQPPS